MCYNKDKEKIQEVYSMANNKTELSVSTDVLEKMAELAAKEVAEKVQKNIKDKLQAMTGNAVTRVNVSIADIEIEENEPEEQ